MDQAGSPGPDDQVTAPPLPLDPSAVASLYGQHAAELRRLALGDRKSVV